MILKSKVNLMRIDTSEINTPEITKLKFESFFQKSHSPMNSRSGFEGINSEISEGVSRNKSMKRIKLDIDKLIKKIERNVFVKSYSYQIDANTTLKKTNYLYESNYKDIPGNSHNVSYTIASERIVFDKKKLGLSNKESRILFYKHAIDRLVERCYLTNLDDVFEELFALTEKIDQFRVPIEFYVNTVANGNGQTLLMIPVEGKGLFLGSYLQDTDANDDFKKDCRDSSVCFNIRKKEHVYTDNEALTFDSIVIVKTFISLNEMKESQLSLYKTLVEWWKSYVPKKFEYVKNTSYCKFLGFDSLDSNLGDEFVDLVNDFMNIYFNDNSFFENSEEKISEYIYDLPMLRKG